MPFESIEALYETASQHPEYQTMLMLCSELELEHAWGDFERVSLLEELLNRVLNVAEHFPGHTFVVGNGGELKLISSVQQ